MLRFALPPLLQMLPLPPRRCQATADVALLRCRHRRSLRAAATALPPSRCAPPLRFVLPPPPLMLPFDASPPPCCRRHRAVATAAASALPPTALPPSRCALPPRFALPPLPLTLPLPPCRRHAAANVALALVDCYISVNSDAFRSPHPTPC